MLYRNIINGVKIKKFSQSTGRVRLFEIQTPTYLQKDLDDAELTEIWQQQIV